MFNQEALLDKEKTNLISVFLQNRPTVMTVEYRNCTVFFEFSTDFCIKNPEGRGDQKTQGKNIGICHGLYLYTRRSLFPSYTLYANMHITMMHCLCKVREIGVWIKKKRKKKDIEIKSMKERKKNCRQASLAPTPRFTGTH